jgi:hypothetical protein
MIKRIKFILIILSLCFISFSLCLNGFAQERQEVRGDDLSYTAYDFRDPFESYLPEETSGEISEQAQASLETEKTKETKPLPVLNIQGIIWKGRLKQVIINNQVLKTGDAIEGATIIRIERDGVTFLYDNKEHKLSSPAFNSYGSLIK